MTTFASAAGTTLSLLLLANPLHAQDVDGASLNGNITLSAGFVPDPYITSIEPGGEDAVADLGAGCSGYIYARAPDFELVIDSATAFIGIFVAASVDTTLVINDPDGNWLCNDDNPDAGGSNPGVTLDGPAQGTYDIWVGTYEKSATGATGKLMITEYAAPQWAGLQIDGDTGESSVTTSTTSDSVAAEAFASAEERACLDGANDYIAELEDFASAVRRADADNVCDEDDVCRTGTHSSGYYYAVGEACDSLLGPFETARQACLAFPDMDNIIYPPLCR